MSSVPPDFPKLFWLGWFLAFVLFEAWAVYSGKTDHTLSYTVWWLAGTGSDDREWFRWLFRVIIVCGALWLIPHFMTKWKWFN